jgi:hypothetical protein
MGYFVGILSYATDVKVDGWCCVSRGSRLLLGSERA